MKTLHKITVISVIVLAAQICRAQMSGVAADTSCKSSIVGVYASSNTSVNYVGDWTTFGGSGGSGTVPANTGSTVGNNVGNVGGCGLWAASGNPFYNGSLRSRIQGSAYGQINNFARYYMDGSSHSYTVTVWGPTLNQFGATGAQNFQWAIWVYNSSGGVVQFYSASGEVNNKAITVPAGCPYIDIQVVPTSSTENGDVLAMVNG